MTRCPIELYKSKGDGGCLRYDVLVPGSRDWFADTDPRALKAWLDLIRKMSPSEKFARVFELTDFVLACTRAGVRSMYPEAGEREIFLRAAARRLDRETMIRA